jgi:competence protein ComEC
MKMFLLIIISIFYLGCTTVNVSHTKALSRQINGELAVHFIDVGLGDCTFITLPDGKNILIDAGSPAAGPIIVGHLKSLGVKQIDHLILTHPHDDHIGGIFSLLSEFNVNNFYDNGFSNFSSAIYGDYIELVREKLPKYNILQAGESLIFDNMKIDVINPLLPPTGNVNNDSIVLRLIYGEIKILLAGDLGALGERRLININTELISQILKASHHGDNDASSADFLERVKPEIAIITVSTINKYARPHQGVIRRLKDAGAKIYRTDQNGHITLKTDGVEYSFNTEKNLTQ